MSTQQRDELNEILGQDDAHLAALLVQHKVRRDGVIDHQARNLSVHVAKRLQKQRPARVYVLGGLATSAAAALVVFALSTTTHAPDADAPATVTVASVVHQQATTTGSANSGIRSGQGCVNIVNVHTKRLAPRPATPGSSSARCASPTTTR